MRSFSQDYQFGLSSEKVVQSQLEKVFGRLIKTDQYFPVDFEGLGVYLEVKTRTCKKSNYPTTLIPYSKVKFAKECGRDVWFVFVFVDGVYCIQYSPKFDQYEVKDFVRGFRVGKTDKVQPYLYIPVADLTSLEGMPRRELPR